MNEEITNKIRELYDNIMYYPNKVLEIFNDFFGEERVDMQGFLNFEEFLRYLSEHNLCTFFFNKQSVLDCPEFKSTCKENKDIIVDMLDAGALDCTVVDDVALATYILPIMTSAAQQIIPQGCILVHFPHVRVTNENDRFVDINHLWVKVGLRANGSGIGYFGVNRSEYELSHMKADYMHSHVSGIPFNRFTEFRSPCLGSGPIRSTVATLAVNYDEAMWQLFCLELDRYVRVESIAGTPYRYLEKIGNGRGSLSSGESDFTMNTVFTTYNALFCREDMKNFIRYLIRGKKLKFNYTNGSYSFAMSYIDFRILISNEFISWYNHEFNLGTITSSYDDLLRNVILRECIINNGRIQYFNTVGSSGRDYREYEGNSVCTFKGRPITIHIVDTTLDTVNKTVLLCSNITENIARAILKIVNYKYGREDRREEAGISTPAIYL